MFANESEVFSFLPKTRLNNTDEETGSLTIVRRSNSRKGDLLQQSDQQSSDHQYDTEATIDNFHSTGDFDNMQAPSTLQAIIKKDDLVTIDLASDNLPAVDTPDACDKAAHRAVTAFMKIEFEHSNANSSQCHSQGHFWPN
ncbi:hypothetical protein Bhyg_05404 [Pseudolycoriella hygida]|uniref:Uncharacterized protein n=1 Tax=Pseudolycoriella hygida TaxID=35572 RepID=A0A9Q0NH13_9DIPT|nr:hypothetical protein Bhyg_05404 [Pseudolycoriella hygida]